MDTELPEDQRIDDARSLTFDSAPLDRTLEILGAPVAELDVSVDRPVAFLAIRLNELTPDGTSRRVTYGVLNLCHRDGHKSPKALEPGRRYRIKLQLRDIAHAFKTGSRLRIALSSTYWPLIWPSPEAVTLSVHTSTSMITLPVRPPRVEDERLAAFGPAFVPKHPNATLLSSAGRGTKEQEWDVASRTLTIRSEGPYHRSRIEETGTEIYGSWREVSTIRDTDPTSPTVEFYRTNGFFRPDWDVRVETRLKVSVTRDVFRIMGEIEAFDEGRSVFSRKWDRPIARRLV
jgi:predicted acyl esterase